MKKVFVSYLLLSMLLLALPVLAEEDRGVYTQDGFDRTYYIYIPSSYTGDEPVPLMVLLHGKGSTGQGMSRSSLMNDVAEEHGFIALYPDGIRNEWDYLNGLPWTDREGIDDVAFIKGLVDQITEEYAIDRERVYVAGLSNGGFMAQRLGCDASDTFAGIASVAATGYSGLGTQCEDSPPIPVMLIHGTDDQIVPWAGFPIATGNGNTLYVSAPAEQTFAFWGVHNGCDPGFEAFELPQLGDSPGTVARLLRDVGCEEGGALQFYTIIGGGHTWPGVRWVGNEQVVGRVNMDFSASEAIWEYFSQFTLDDGIFQ